MLGARGQIMKSDIDSAQTACRMATCLEALAGHGGLPSDISARPNPPFAARMIAYENCLKRNLCGTETPSSPKCVSGDSRKYGDLV
jgi:hypothetical protein